MYGWVILGEKSSLPSTKEICRPNVDESRPPGNYIKWPRYVILKFSKDEDLLKKIFGK